MKHRFPFVAAVTCAAALSALVMSTAPAQAATCVTLEVRNVRAEQGMLMIAAYAEAGSFDKTPVVATQTKAAGETMTFPLCGFTGGTAAFTLYQDLNGNGQLDKNVLGIPSEPWGASGTPAAMSAPTWDTTSVPLVEGATIVVKLSK
ncbi:MAG: DUF2141 domain-containing protein [Pseudomonadota bacterium]|nr:DUF2141 domain-containing protein [Pseudomonadota bacterium]